MTSVGSNVNAFCVDIHMELISLPSPPICMRPPELDTPLRMDVINGWPTMCVKIPFKPKQCLKTASYLQIVLLLKGTHLKFLLDVKLYYKICYHKEFV